MELTAQAPAVRVFSVTKSDTTLVNARSLWVGTAGTANLEDASGATLTNFPLLAGLNPINVQRVKTGGTAADIWALL